MVPRARAVDEAWRAIGAGVESLSGPDGGPLTRTVKLLLLPLVIRPTLRPELAADVLSLTDAARLRELLTEAAGTLRATSAWFALMKRARRRSRVVAGNPQDRYFPVCFELAATHGAPTPDTEVIADRRVAELAELDGGRTVDALKVYLRDNAHRIRLARSIDRHWRDRDVSVSDPATSVAAAVRVLTGCGDRRTRRDATAELAKMADAGDGANVGAAMWSDRSNLWGAEDFPASLRLSDRAVPARPEIGTGSSTASLPAPLDRTLHDRLFIVLRGSRRESLPPVPELAATEAGRCCAPLGLLDETLRVALVVGGRLAVGLDPLGGNATPLADTSAHHAVNGRFRREASVLRARRMTTGPDTEGGTLAELAEELRTVWIAYMRRLWVRLHGRDTHSEPLTDGTELWDLLDGVARSIVMDHRAKVRQALRALTASETADA
ncbi:Lantibiotic dehydratase, C terminus [Stackebrandtia soli]